MKDPVDPRSFSWRQFGAASSTPLQATLLATHSVGVEHARLAELVFRPRRATTQTVRVSPENFDGSGVSREFPGSTVCNSRVLAARSAVEFVN